MPAIICPCCGRGAELKPVRRMPGVMRCEYCREKLVETEKGYAPLERRKLSPRELWDMIRRRFL